MTDIVERLNEVGDWVSDKEWHQHPLAAEAQREIKRWRANPKDAVLWRKRHKPNGWTFAPNTVHS